MIQKKTIRLSDEFRSACPDFAGCVVYAPVSNTDFDPRLWAEIDATTLSLRRDYTPDTVKLRPGILATREGYKRCGKDPSRYRPSNEQLCRRLLQGKELYRVSTVVDLINLASMTYAYSIGGFDLDKVVGEEIVLGIGREGEDYEGIGRGPLNIAGMPVYRDAVGGIGTPTSDHERTKLSLATRHLMAFVNGYDGNRQSTLQCAQLIARLLVDYAQTPAEEILIEEY